MPPSLERSHRWISCLTVVIALMGIIMAPKFWSGPRPEGMPFGVMLIPGTQALGEQDFACHIHYLRQIWNRNLEHPYRLEEQERVARAWCPRNSTGFPHAYSPVALVVAAPLLLLKTAWAYAAWTVINGALLLALTWGWLFRRMQNAVQGGAIAAVFCSYVMLDIFNMGQTALATTCLVAGICLLLRERPGRAPGFANDLLLGAVLYVLAFKPSVALIGFALVIGRRAWRPLVLAGALLGLTWAALGPYYGGYVEGLKDYGWLLGHYCSADLPSYFGGSVGPEVGTNFTAFITGLHPGWNHPAFEACRFIYGMLVALLALLGWSRRISFAVMFQGLLWTFLLFCPFLLVTEDFILCLLAVEGTFFRRGLNGAVKIVLVVLAVNFWIGALLGWPLVFVAKLVLAGWWLGELVARREP